MFPNSKSHLVEKSGFALLEILLAVAVLVILGGGGALYTREMRQQKSIMQVGLETEKKAQELKKQIEQQQENLYKDVVVPNSPKGGKVDTSNWKTYRNEKYGFTLSYQSDLPELTVLTNDLSPIAYSPVAGEPIFEIHLFDNSDQFSNPLYNFEDGYDHQLTYSAKGQNWVVTLTDRKWNGVSGSPDEHCPLEYTTSNQGVPYYRITTGHHAGDGFNAYITEKGLIAVVGGEYYESGKFYPEKITFDHSELVLKASCHIVKTGK